MFPPIIFELGTFYDNISLIKFNDMTLLKIILAIILPPVAVFLQGGIGLYFWVNILLTILGVVPGMIHAPWLVAKKKS